MKINERKYVNKYCILLVLLNVILFRIIGYYSDYFYLDTPLRMMWVKRSISSFFFHRDVEVTYLSFVPQILANRVFGDSVKVLYLAQFVVFILGIVVLYMLLSKLLKSKLARVICVLVVYTLSTFAENIFTNGKAETTVLVSFILFSYFFYLILFDKNNNLQISKYVFFEISIIFTLFSKVTGIVIIVPVIILYLYYSFYEKNSEKKKKMLTILVLVSLNLLLWFVYNKVFRIPSTYTSYNITFYSIYNNLYSYIKYNFDVFFMGIISFVFILREIFSKERNEDVSFLLAINLMGWAYIVGMCFWRWSSSYYLFPVSALFAISTTSFFRSKEFKEKSIVLILIVIVGVYGIRTNYLVATSQIDVGQIYAESINDILDLSEADARVLIATSDFYEEPVVQTQRLLNNVFDKKIQICGINQNLLNKNMKDYSDILALYGYTLEQYNVLKEGLNPKKGDYIIVYENDRNFYGNIRGINPSLINNGIDDSLKQYDLKLLSENKIERKYIGLDNRKLTIKANYAGYKLYQVNKVRSYVQGVYQDGWTEENFVIKNYTIGEGLQISIRDIGTTINGYKENDLSIYVNDKKIENFIVRGTNEVIDMDSTLKGFEGSIDINFSVNKTFCPLDLGFSSDNREIGLCIIVNYIE